MIRRLCLTLAAAAAWMAYSTTPAGAVPVGNGNLVVLRSGSGTGTLNSNAHAAFLEERSTAGALVQTIALPTAASGGQNALTLTGSATAEGFLSASVDQRYVLFGGYNAAPGSPAPSNVSNNHVIGRLGLDGVVDTSTLALDAADSIRSVVSDYGTNLWYSTAATGVRATTLGSTTAGTQFTSTTSPNPTALRVANIFNNNIYVDGNTATGPLRGVGLVSGGLTTTIGQTITQLPGFPTLTGPSPYDFWFKDATTLYVADDRTTASGGGIQRWTFDGANWALGYTLALGTTGARGLIGTVDGDGNAVLYATTTETTANRLVGITDTGALSAFSLLATAPANTAFRGVELIIHPVPEASALLLVGLVGGLGTAAAAWRRRSRS